MSIHTDCERGNLKVVREIIDADPSQVHVKDALGNQPLHVAAWQRREKIAQLLLSKGADVNARGDCGRTPLHYAVENNASAVTKLLLEHGADTGIQSDFGVSPLYSAASVGDRKMVDLLVKHGAFKDLGASVYLDGPDSVVTQLQSDPNVANTIGQSKNLLWDAIRVQSENLVRLLLEHGANPNAKVGGLYPIHHAISHHLLPIVRLLLDRGADPTVKDQDGQSLLAFSQVYNATPEIRELLQERGAP